MLKCVLLLSDKSSGSSAIQREFLKHPHVQVVHETRHHYKETLYWNKAAALLGKQQQTMRYSELPLSARMARQDLEKLLTDNVTDFKIPASNHDLVFQGWRALAAKFQPVFFEKSPHHLHYESTLELIRECETIFPELRFYFIGVVRNPMDTLYSMWKRWSAVPEIAQYEWLRAYSNLLHFQKVFPERCTMVKYEELVADPSIIQNLCDFLEIERSEDIGSGLHARSIRKWQTDKWFGFQLDKDVDNLALQFGYESVNLMNMPHPLWPLIRASRQYNYLLNSAYTQAKNSVRSIWKRSS